MASDSPDPRRHPGEPLLESRSPSRQNAPFGEQPRSACFIHPLARVEPRSLRRRLRAGRPGRYAGSAPSARFRCWYDRDASRDCEKRSSTVTPTPDSRPRSAPTHESTPLVIVLFSGLDPDAESVRLGWERAGRVRIERARRVVSLVEVDGRPAIVVGEVGVEESRGRIGF